MRKKQILSITLGENASLRDNVYATIHELDTECPYGLILKHYKIIHNQCPSSECFQYV